MTIDTSLLRRELEQQRDVLAIWRRQEQLSGLRYPFTIAKVEKRIAELQAQLKTLEADNEPRSAS